MKTFKNIKNMIGIRCYGKITDSNLYKRYVITNIFHYLSSTHGDLYAGRYKKLGIYKFGKFYIVQGEALGVIDEPEYYK